MRFLIILLFIFISNSQASNEYPGEWELTRLLLQQKFLHKDNNRDFFNNIISDWKASLSELKLKPQKVYVMWEPSEQSMAWLQEFMSLLMADLSGIGLTLSDRVKNRETLKATEKDSLQINSCNSFLIFNTSSTKPNGYSASCLAINRDWHSITDRIFGKDDAPKLEPHCIFPLRINGYSSVISYGEAKDHSDFILPETKINEFCYLDLLIQFTKLCYHLKEDECDFKVTLDETRKCLPGLLHNLESIDEEFSKRLLYALASRNNKTN